MEVWRDSAHLLFMLPEVWIDSSQKWRFWLSLFTLIEQTRSQVSDHLEGCSVFSEGLPYPFLLAPSGHTPAWSLGMKHKAYWHRLDDLVASSLEGIWHSHCDNNVMRVLDLFYRSLLCLGSQKLPPGISVSMVKAVFISFFPLFFQPSCHPAGLWPW